MVELGEMEHCIVSMVPLLDSVPKNLLLVLLAHLNKTRVTKLELMSKQRPKFNYIKINNFFTAKHTVKRIYDKL